MSSDTVRPTLYTPASLYSMTLSVAIIFNKFDNFKELLHSTKESLSEDERYAIAYNVCLARDDKKFLNYLILETNFRENLISSKYITEEVRALFAKRRADALQKELPVNTSKDSKPKI